MKQYGTSGPAVLVTGPRMRPEIMTALKSFCRVTQWTDSDSMPLDVMKEELPKAEVLVRAFRAPLEEEAIRAGRHLKLIVQGFVGYEGVDVEACTKYGVPFCNAASPSSYTVAEMALTLILASRRRLIACAETVKDGTWGTRTHSQLLMGHNLKGSTAGILGMGHIGLVLAGQLRAMGMRVIYHNRRPRKDDAEKGVQWAPLSMLCQESDIVIDILPASAATHQMVDLSFFRQMKQSALFVNVGRGDTVVTDDLVTALEEKSIAAAALDVCDPEPLPPNHPLLSMEQVLVTPHMASDTEEVVAEKVQCVVKNIRHAVYGGPLTDCINPEVLKMRKIEKQKACAKQASL